MVFVSFVPNSFYCVVFTVAFAGDLFDKPMKFCCGKKGSKPQSKSFQEESKRGRGGKE